MKNPELSSSDITNKDFADVFRRGTVDEKMRFLEQVDYEIFAIQNRTNNMILAAQIGIEF